MLNSATLRRGLVAAAASTILFACSAGPSAQTAVPGGAGDGTSAPISIPEGNRPSHALARVVNLFNPVKSDPGPIDVYAAAFVEAGAKPLLSVPYGQVSQPFDPTVVDDQGDVFLSFYSSGVTGNGKELFSDTRITVKGGENLVFYLVTGILQDDGTYGGALGTKSASPAGAFGAVETLPAGKALVDLETGGAAPAIKPTESMSWLVSFGASCASGLTGGPEDIAILRPGQGGARLPVDPGSATLSLHEFDESAGVAPDCSNKSFLDIPLTLTAEEYTLVLVYAPKDGDIRTLEVPLSK